MSLLYFVVRVRCHRKESSRSLSHLLMSFLFDEEVKAVGAATSGHQPPAITAVADMSLLILSPCSTRQVT